MLLSRHFRRLARAVQGADIIIDVGTDKVLQRTRAIRAAEL
jgi:hypothetical protein